MTRKEETERASVDYQMSTKPMAIGGSAFSDLIYRANINPSFVAGAQWADKTMIERACKWLNNFNAYRLCLEGQKDYFIESFRKAMQNE